jgi:hypothetical protein
LKLGSLFDGSGGFPLSGVLNGIEPVWAAEVEPYPIAVTVSKFGGKRMSMTNADKIRAMSDEELQKFLQEFESGDIDYAKTFCDLCCKDAALERRSVDCEGCLLLWLKSDAKQPQGLDYWTRQPAETEGTE